MSAEEATINPDGTTTFGNEGGAYADSGSGDGADFSGDGENSEGAEEILKGTDPAFYLAAVFLIIVGLWYFMYSRSKKQREDREAFFTEMDGDKVRLMFLKI